MDDGDIASETHTSERSASRTGDKMTAKDTLRAFTDAMRV